MPKPTLPIELAPEEKERLCRWRDNPTTEQRLAKRAAIVLMLAEGEKVVEVARRCNTSRQSVGKWKGRFLQQGLEGLYDTDRPGRPPKYGAEKEEEIVKATLGQPEVETRWSARRLAREVGVSHMTVYRVWKRYGLQPHRINLQVQQRHPAGREDH